MLSNAGLYAGARANVFTYCFLLPLQAKRWAPLMQNLQVTCM